MPGTPLVSFVAAPDGTAWERAAAILELLAWQCHALELPAEMILVEREDAPPPPGRAVRPPAGAALAVRVLRVRLPAEPRADPSAAASLRLRHNAGIRAAGGRFVAALGADRLPGPQLLRWIARGGPEPGALHWAAGWFCDATADDRTAPPRERLAALTGGLHHVQTPFGAHPVRFAPGAPPHQLAWELADWTRRFIGQRFAELRRRGNPPPILPFDDFLLMSRADWHALRGFPEWRVLQGNFGTILGVLALAAGRELRFAGADRPVLALTAGPHLPAPDIGLAVEETEDEGERLLTPRLSAWAHLTDDHAHGLAARLLDIDALRWADGIAAIANPTPLAVTANGLDWGTAAEIIDDSRG